MKQQQKYYELWYLTEWLPHGADKQRIGDYLCTNYNLKEEQLASPVRLAGSLDRRSANAQYRKLGALVGNAAAIMLVRPGDLFTVTITRAGKTRSRNELYEKLAAFSGKEAPSSFPYTLEDCFTYAQAQDIASELGKVGAKCEITPVFSRDSAIKAAAALFVLACIIYGGISVINLQAKLNEDQRTALIHKKVESIRSAERTKSLAKISALLGQAAKEKTLAGRTDIVVKLGEIGEFTDEAVDYVIGFLHDRTKLKLKFMVNGVPLTERPTTPRERAIVALARMGGERAAAALAAELDEWTKEPSPATSEVDEFQGIFADAFCVSGDKDLLKVICELAGTRPAWFSPLDSARETCIQALLKNHC